MRFNQITLSGRAYNVQTKQVGSHTVTSFGLKQSRQKKGEFVSDWFNVECWNKAAEYASGFQKGEWVLISGEIQQDTWKDKQTGDNKSKYKVLAHRVRQFPVQKNEAPDDFATATASSEMTEEDVPF